MAFKKIPLTIDTMIRNPVPVEGINQEDNIELNIVVTENKTPKDLSSQTIKVYVRRIDGTLVEQTDQITPTNASKGEVTVKLKNSAFNKEGYALFQLDISDSSGRITSSYATFKIGKGLVSGEAIANTNEIEALKKVEEYIKKANQELEIFKQTVAEINENEAIRQENEVVRVNEEASRNEAEAIRAQQEATRKEKENERVQAEIQRIADEEMRRENEALRGSKELERKQAEELRKEKELLRIADENNRKVAESKRIEAESVRVEAEKLRVAAETGRVEAENLRTTAEEERVAAETKREEGFNKFEGKINANTEELKNARSATTGEKFDTLDERIDCEVDRLNKKIEVSFLQQEDKESHTIENTVDGMTTDMVIKGRTLINMVKLGSISKNIGIAYDSLAIYSYTYDLKNDTDYTIIFEIENKTDEKQVRISLNGGKSGRGINVKNGFNVVKIRSESEKNNKLMFYYSSEHSGDGAVKNVILLEGDWTNKPIPEYFEGIKSFGQQEDKISILSNGKNLLNINDFYNTLKGINDNAIFEEIKDGRDCIKISQNYEYYSNGYKNIKFKEKTQYTFTGEAFHTSDNWAILTIKYVDGSYTDIRIAPNSWERFNVASDRDKTILSINSVYTTNTFAYINKNTFMIEEGEYATKFEQYKSYKKDILLSSLGFDEGLRGLNLTVCDKLNDIKNVAIKRVEKHSFTGNENISLHDTQTETVSFRYLNDTHITSWDNPSNLLCTSLPSIGNKIYESNNVGCASDNIGFIFRLNKNSLTSQNVEGFKKWLKENPTTIYYELAEPVETPLDENIKLKVYNEKTYLSFENAISGTSSFKAPVNTLKTIARLSNENTRLKRDLALHAENTIATDEAITDYSLDMDYKLCLLEMELVEIKKKLGGK